MEVFTHPRSCRFSSDLIVEVNGRKVEVLRTDVADFANFVFDPLDGPVDVVITRIHDFVKAAAVRPVSKAIQVEVDDHSVRFTLQETEKVSVEIDGLLPLFLWANPPETDKPDPDAPDVLYYRAGQIYEVGVLTMEDNQTLYLEAGAVIKGRIHVKGKHNICIRGYGILDGDYYQRERKEAKRSILLEHCEQVTVRDITMIHPSAWMLVPGACRDVTIYNIKQIGEVVCSDGIDVVGSRDVLIENCFLRNNDDCVVIKAFVMGKNNPNAESIDFRQCPKNILIRNCTLLNAQAGNAMEIGHELSVDTVSNIRFENIDVLSVHGSGAVFSIHNNDHACVRDIIFDDIRVEHCYDKFIDFRISKSRYSSDEERGHIRNVTLRNIQWTRSRVSEGYTISLIGGWDQAHTIEGVTFESISINGRQILDLDELEICTRYASDIHLFK